MSQEFFTGYLYVALFLAAGAALVVAGLIFGRLVAPSRKKGGDAFRVYESGEEATGQAQVQFPSRFYLFALVFVIFDVEAIFMIAWAVRFSALGLQGLVEMAAFIGVLLIGLVYAWRKGVLRWV